MLGNEEAIKRAMVAIGQHKRAPARAIIACLVIGYQENNWNETTCNSSNHCGVFQLDSGWQRQHDYTDTVYWINYAYDNGFFSNGGLIQIANQNPGISIGQIVENCQGAGQSAVPYYDQADGAATADYNRLAGQNLPVPTGTGGGGPITGTGGTSGPAIDLSPLQDGITGTSAVRYFLPGCTDGQRRAYLGWQASSEAWGEYEPLSVFTTRGAQ